MAGVRPSTSISIYTTIACQGGEEHLVEPGGVLADV
jgi:hypothetical protein